ncbi:tyrosine phosphatase family-domain-containing protein [Aspergillus cavernicola]|uniref:diphosphoinositol-polyphosphate diphosphatase n=1 Tax=Aspergillus cavernicola TaxID=176166 RepID=A0ABR4J2U4_9EURO
MTYPLSKKNANGVTESNQVDKQGTRVSSVDPIGPDVGKSELPENFGEVVKGIYRSSFPQPWNLPPLESLGLKTIITLVEEPYTQSHMTFLKENAVTHHRIAFIANKDAAVRTPESVLHRIIEIILDKANHPILIHCNKGKHRTGCVTGCFRKLQGWNMQDIINEYVHYSFPKQRPLDEAFIEAFDPSKLSHLAQLSGAKLWLPTGAYPSTRQEKEQESSRRLVQLTCNGIRVS